MDLLIKNTLLKNQVVDIHICGNKINKIGKEIQIAPEKECTIINGKGTAVIPPLFNGHTHSPMVLLRGYGDDMSLDKWLTSKIFPIEARLNEEDYFWGNKLAFLEMIKSGTTFFNEMYMNPGSALNALKDLPLKALINYTIIDGMDEVSGKNQVRECEDFFNKVTVPDGIQLGVALHSVYANSEFTLQWVRDFAAERNLKVHIHLCETEKEVVDCRKNHDGLSPVEYLNAMNFLNERVFAAHSVWLSEKDMDIYAENGVVAIYNPVSNMKLVSGEVFPYKELKKRSVPMLLGTDGAASNNNLNLFEEMKIGSLLQKHHYRDPALMAAEDIFTITTKKSAEIFGTGGGVIAEGYEADLILIDTEIPEMVPLTNLVSNLVYSSANAVKTVICGGKILMENRIVPGEDEIREKAALCASNLIGRAVNG